MIEYASLFTNLIKSENSVMEFQLEKIGINKDKIERATQILKGDRGYVCTEEREKLDEEQEKKRKAEEQLNEQEEKRLKTVTSGEEPKEKEQEKSAEEGHENKLARTITRRETYYCSESINIKWSRNNR